MNIAARMARLGTESAFEVLARAKALERAGREIVHLEIGEPDFDTPAHIKEAAKRALDAGATHYGPSAGLPELREAIAKHVAETRGVPVSPDEVVVTPGAKPIMFFTILALVGEGDEVIYPNPGFPIYESVINFVGGVPVPIPLLEASGFGFDLDAFERRVSPRTRLIIINSPENPTGGVLDRGQLELIADVARRRGIPILSDEIYRQFLYEGEFVSITGFPGMRERTILLDGFSKSYAMTGWRLGYGVMPPALAEHVTRLMVNSASCTATFVQLAGLAALEGDQTPVARMVAEFKRRRDLLVEGLNRLPGVTCARPRGVSTTVADVVVDGLQRAGTPRIFGVPGHGSQLPLVEAARRRGLPVVLAHDEAAACVMAAVTGDLVSAPGAALAAPGPGVAAAATGVARAPLDRAPMIPVTDRPPESVHGCKASLALDAASASRWTAHAAQLAMQEPRGPVHLDVPAKVAGAPAVPMAASCRPEPLPPPDPRALDEAARLLANASHPVLIAGLQCRSATDAQWLRALAEALPAPVLLTLRAKGVLPDPHPLMHGVLWPGGGEGPLLGRADLIVALGLDAIEVSPSPWMTTAPLLYLAPSPATGEWYRPVVQVVGEIALAIAELAPRLHGRARADWDVAELDRLKRPLRPRSGAAVGRLTPERIARLAREATAAGTIAALDAGPHAGAVAAAWDAVAPGEFLASYGPATAGFALPAAIAAHLVHPERRAVCFTGGEGFLAALSELPTAIRLRAPIVVVAIADGSSDAPELVRMGQRFAVPSAAADSEASFAQALARALRADGPALIAAWS